MSNLWWVYALFSAFFAALTAIFAKLGVDQVNSNLATAIRTAVILVLVWGIVVATGEVRELATVPRSAWLALMLSAASTGLSWLFYFRALQLGQTSYVVAVDKSSIVMVLVLSVLFLHENVDLQAVAGTIAIMIGVLLLIY